MSKYKLINRKTNEETICDKVEIEGFEYYISTTQSKRGWFYCHRTKNIFKDEGFDVLCCNSDSNIIATTNRNIDCPQVVDEVGKAWEEVANSARHKKQGVNPYSFYEGYNKAKEQFKWTDEDVLSFLNWLKDNCIVDSAPKPFYRGNNERKTHKELLQLWQESNPKVIYYE